MTLVRRQAGRNHYYRDIDENGDEWPLPNVTGILNDSIAKPGLTSWAAGEAASYAVEHWDALSKLGLLERGNTIKAAARGELSAASGKGTLIHEIAERATRGEKVDIPEGLEGYIESCVRFLDQYEVEPVLTETPVINRAVPYAGTLDLVADMLGHRWLLDWKTGKSVYGETALQLAAYARAEHYLDGRTEKPLAPIGIERAAVVHLRSDGFDVYPMRIDESVYSLFRTCAVVAKWTHWDRDTGSALDRLKSPALLPQRVA